NLALNLHYGADVLILGWFLGPSAVVIYACTCKLISLSTSQVCSLATVAGPALSELRMSGRGEQVRRASTALGQLVLLTSGLVAAVILATNEGFVTWWVGPSLYGGMTLTLLVLSVMVARHLAFTFAHILVCLGQERNVALVVLADGIVIVGSIFALVPACGLLAAPLGSLLGVSGVTLPLFVFLLARQTQFSAGRLLRVYFPWAWRATLTAGVAVGLSTVWTPSNLARLALTAAGISAVYLVLMLPALAETPLG